MTHEEIIKAADAGTAVVYDDPQNGKTAYKRISAVYWRYAGERERRRGVPKKYMQVELEDFSGTSVTIAKPDRVSGIV